MTQFSSTALSDETCEIHRRGSNISDSGIRASPGLLLLKVIKYMISGTVPNAVTWKASRIYLVKDATYHGPIRRFCNGLSGRILRHLVDPNFDKRFQKIDSTCLEMAGTAHSDVTRV
jgi:hypothetical protein